MQRKLLAIFTILVAAFAAVSVIALSTTAQQTVVGKVYTMDNAAANNVWQCDRMSDGSLVASGVFSTGGNGTGSKLASQGAVTLSDDGMWLFVVNAGSDELSVFQATSSGLTLTDKVSSHGTAPISVTVNRNWVYVLNNGSATVPSNIAGFQINSTGKLIYIAGSTQPLSGQPNTAPEQIGFTPQGNMLVATEKAANITNVYTLNNDGAAGAPNSLPSVGTGPYGFAFTSSGILVLSEATSNTMSTLTWTPNGSLRTVSGAIPCFQMAPCWVVVTDNDQWVYTANGPGSISTYAVSSGGLLLLTSSIAAKLDAPAFDLALSSNSEFLYSLNGNNITGFQVFPEDGGLWQITNIPNLPPATTGLAAT